eukprot:TRINITY_DN38138_c0_g1_i1.p1 TRINITY_DN38138_c0_g1~~TRINITY_DN38138_c0_g1_i1.p1  ORF type:complete len:470 (-),score=56.29 TRINITY_DN38138_c0_g1_i1:342-1751(-)
MSTSGNESITLSQQHENKRQEVCLSAAWDLAANLRQSTKEQQKLSMILWWTSSLCLFFTTIVTVVATSLFYAEEDEKELDPIAERNLKIAKLTIAILPILATLLVTINANLIPKFKWAVCDAATTQTLRQIYLFRAWNGADYSNKEAPSKKEQRLSSDGFLFFLKRVRSSVHEQIPDWTIPSMRGPRKYMQEFMDKTYLKSAAIKSKTAAVGTFQFKLPDKSLSQDDDELSLSEIFCQSLLLALISSALLYGFTTLPKQERMEFEHTMQRPYVWIPLVMAVSWAVLKYILHSVSRRDLRQPGSYRPVDSDIDEAPRIDDGYSPLTPKEYLVLRAEPLCCRLEGLCEDLVMLGTVIRFLRYGNLLASTLLSVIVTDYQKWVTVVLLWEMIVAGFVQWYSLDQHISNLRVASDSINTLLPKLRAEIIASNQPDYLQIWANIEKLEDSFLSAVNGFNERLKVNTQLFNSEES